MREWVEKPLADVVELRRGFDLAHRDRRPGAYPVLSSGETAGWHDEGPIKGPGMVVGRATNLGKPTWSDIDFWPLNTTLYVSDFKGNFPRWVFHLFEVLDLTGFDSGSVQPMLNRNYIAQVPVKVPPLYVQRAIAEVLGALDDKIAANVTLSAQIESYLEALYRRMRIDDEPAQGVGVPLTSLIALNPRLPVPAAEAPVYVDMQKLPVSGPSIDDWDARPAKGGARFQNGDTLLARITPCLENRKTGYVDFLGDGEVAVGSTEFIVMRSCPGVPSELSYFIATGPRFREFAIRHMVGTSGRQRVAASALGEFELTMPSALELRQFGDESGPMFGVIRSLRDENRTLAATRDALLPALMSGRLTVRDAERAAGEVV